MDVETGLFLLVLYSGCYKALLTRTNTGYGKIMFNISYVNTSHSNGIFGLSLAF